MKKFENKKIIHLRGRFLSRRYPFLKQQQQQQGKNTLHSHKCVRRMEHC